MKILEVPNTEDYQILKRELSSTSFTWCYEETPHGPLNEWDPEDIKKYNGDPFFSHCVLMPARLEHPYSIVKSEYAGLCSKVILDTISYNNIEAYSIMRINLNMTFPSKKNLPDKPHVDHPYPHSNMLFYFTENGGKTVIQEETGDVEYTPVKDTCILFDGLCKHYQWYPDTGRRVVMVVTFI